MVLQFALHIILILWPIHTLTYAQNPIAKSGCQSMCGDVEIPYPFGMKDPKCYADKWFEIECRNSNSQGQTNASFLKSINLEVTSIDVMESTINIMNPVYHWNCQHKAPQRFLNLSGSPFVYSQSGNKFVAIGCNIVAFLLSSGTEVGGCVSICDANEEVDEDVRICNGKYCCETSLPLYLSEYNATFEVLRKNHVSDQCSHAVIIEEYYWNRYYQQDSSYTYLESSYTYPEYPSFQNLTYVPAVLEWEVLNSTLKLPPNCHHANVTSSNNTHSGRRCECSTEFEKGNPYIAGGCYVNHHYHHFPKKNRLGPVGVFSSLGSIISLIGLWWLFKVVREKIVKKRLEKFFKRNGGLLLEQRISSSEANADKAKHFSLKDIEKATDNFNRNRVLGKGGQGTVYKGMLVDGKIVAVKKFKVQGNVDEFINEFVILSQINHRNVVKLIGCCLETEIPLLVYEFIPNGNLFEYLHEQNEDLPITWDTRLRIAAEVAGALFYLHSAASQPIYHRDIKSTNILLDEKYRAKVADFGASRMISIENTHLTTVVQGTFGYLDPEYFHTSQFTEKSDVYSFGVVLVELLTGQKPISSLRPQEFKSLASYFVLSMEDESRLFDIIDERVTKEGDKEHIIAVANLANRCLDLNRKKRPTMKEVTMELEGIRNMIRKSNAQQNHEVIELAANEDHLPWVEYGSPYTWPTIDDRASTSEVVSILSK